jgi:phosphatidylserine decarboxylase
MFKKMISLYTRTLNNFEMPDFKKGDVVYCYSEQFIYMGKRGSTAVLRKENNHTDYGRPLIDLKKAQ